MANARAPIPSLDGLRAISFSIVFLSHAGLSSIVPGGFGVTVFFFLSGYLITTLLRIELERTGRISLRNFYVRRALRILPPFYLVLLFAVVVAQVTSLNGTFTWAGIAAQCFHVANYWIVLRGWSDFPPGTGVYWSLAVEEHFYLLFPLLYMFMHKLGMSRPRQAGVLLLLCLAALLWRFVLTAAMGAPSDRVFVATDTRFDSILFGCVLAVWGNPSLEPTRIDHRVWKYVLLPMGLVALGAGFVIRNPDFRDSLRFTLQGAGLWPLFVCAVRYPEWAPMRLLNLRPVRWIGELSYSLYLVHQIILMMLFERDPLGIGAASSALLSLLVAVGFSWLLFKLVEQPIAVVRRRFAG